MGHCRNCVVRCCVCCFAFGSGAFALKSKKFFASLDKKSISIHKKRYIYMEGGEYMTQYIYALMELEQLLLKGKQELQEIIEILDNEILTTKKLIERQ